MVSWNLNWFRILFHQPLTPSPKIKISDHFGMRKIVIMLLEISTERVRLEIHWKVFCQKFEQPLKRPTPRIARRFFPLLWVESQTKENKFGCSNLKLLASIIELPLKKADTPLKFVAWKPKMYELRVCCTCQNRFKLAPSRHLDPTFERSDGWGPCLRHGAKAGSVDWTCPHPQLPYLRDQGWFLFWFLFTNLLAMFKNYVFNSSSKDICV